MWYSIKSIVTPKTLTEAYSLSQNEGHVLLSGGSYLVAEKDPSIHTLIDINQLINHTVRADYNAVIIEAGATLQEFLDCVTPVNPNCRLLNGVRDSCPSKNIRNQRTFGGEAGQNRPNSDILVFLHAVDAELTVQTNSAKTISIREWNGNGIIARVSYYPSQIESIELQRYSVLPSAPAIALVGGIRKNGNLEFSIGGTAHKIQTFVINEHDWTEEKIENIAKEAINEFIPDHLGSLKYKEVLIATAVKRVGDKL